MVDKEIKKIQHGASAIFKPRLLINQNNVSTREHNYRRSKTPRKIYLETDLKMLRLILTKINQILKNLNVVSNKTFV
jgi:hypothetical protein